MTPLTGALYSLASKAIQNKHTSAAAVVYALAKWGCPILGVWFPSHKDQFDATAGYLEGAAVGYGLLMAGDAGKSATKEEVAEAIDTGDTSHLKKAVESSTVTTPADSSKPKP